MKVYLTFVKNTLMIPKTFGIQRIFILCADKNKLSGRFASHYDWCKTNTAYYNKNIILQFKHSGGSVTVWACFSASALEQRGWLLLSEQENLSAMLLCFV